MNHLIEEQSQLKELEPLFEQLKEAGGHVAVDTEFLREKTYNAKLCLVQLGIAEHQYVIDVLAIEDLSALADLLSDQRVVKVLHAARQDMEVLYQCFGVMPRPIFDTQLAVAFCGIDAQIGYAGLVKEFIDLELPKSQARTDWTRRPLSAEQIAYAADDVEYLTPLYERARDMLEAQGKSGWYAEELESYYDPEKYVIDPASAWQRLSGGGFNLQQQYVLQALAGWREQMAQDRDIPRSWILRDDKLFDLAAKRPTTIEAVRAINAFGKKSSRYLVPQAAELIANVSVGEQRIWNKVRPLDKRQKGVCNAMMKQLTRLAEQHDVAQGLLANRRDVESLYRNRDSEKLLSGWRRALVGEPLLAFVQEHEQLAAAGT